MTSFRIDSRREPSHVELQQSSPADWYLHITAPGLTLGLQVDATGYGYGEPLGAYFGRLADDWRGWDGAREWFSLEGEYGFVATHDGRGHVELRVHVRQNPREGWTADVGVLVEAGDHLAALARAAARFDKSAY